MFELGPRTGILIIRAWNEPDDGRLRARVTCTADVDTGTSQVTTTVDPDAIRAIVDEFLMAFDGATSR